MSVVSKCCIKIGNATEVMVFYTGTVASVALNFFDATHW